MLIWIFVMTAALALCKVFLCWVDSFAARSGARGVCKSLRLLQKWLKAILTEFYTIGNEQSLASMMQTTNSTSRWQNISGRQQ